MDLIPDHSNKINIVIKQATQFLFAFQVIRKDITLLHYIPLIFTCVISRNTHISIESYLISKNSNNPSMNSNSFCSCRILPQCWWLLTAGDWKVIMTMTISFFVYFSFLVLKSTHVYTHLHIVLGCTWILLWRQVTLNIPLYVYWQFMYYL